MSSFGKLKPEFKAAWIAALRSGKYKQGKSTLHNQATDSYCCLGVACVVSNTEYFKMVPEEDTGKLVRHDMGLPQKKDAELWWEELPALVTNYDSPEVMVPKLDYPVRLTDLNDDFNYTFEQIADLIEKYL